MLGFVYLVLILGWISIVIFLKCKKAIAPHFAYTDNYPDAMSERRPSVHVIQLHTESDMDSCNQRMHSTIEEQMMERTFPTDNNVINPAYTNDEDFFINTPPPSYEEVMRKPEIYPKVHETTKSSSNI